MAALLPKEWTVRLIDCNAEALTDDDLAWADLAMTGGMLVQQRETFAIIRRCHSRRLHVAVGGPDATSSPHLYCEADYLVLGEVEPILAEFVAAVDNDVTADDLRRKDTRSTLLPRRSRGSTCSTSIIISR